MNDTKLTVHLLRSAGFRVEVNHKRFYKFLRDGNVITTEPLAKWEACLVFSPNEIINGRQQKGGTTVVRITSPYGDEWQTEVVCSKEDNFCRGKAVEIALQRLVADTPFFRKVASGFLKANDLAIGVWSTDAAEGYGYVRYKTPGGGRISVTAVTQDIDWINTGYNWKDKIIAGIVCYHGFIDRPSYGKHGKNILSY